MVGNPCDFDLEDGGAYGATDFEPPVFHTSVGRTGRYDLEFEKKGIGALSHSAWTYWGHSGAPLLCADGGLAGLHSTWDEERTLRECNRHAVGGPDLRDFLQQAGVYQSE